MNLTEVNIYPIKSLKGIRLETAVIEDRGLRYDRRWMLVDQKNKFITQREFPKMAALSVEVQDDYLKVTNGSDRMDVPFESYGNEMASVTIWGSRVKSEVYQPVVNRWFSDKLGTDCRLVRMPDNRNRIVNPNYAVRKFVDTVSFADGYPFMLMNEASLAELNSLLPEPVPMDRFRPNFVVRGSVPFEEDRWKTIRIGSTVFHVVKSCERCMIPTIDQDLGVKTGKEPIKTLNEIRNFGGKVLLGRYLIADASGGSAGVGDDVEVLQTK
jgi:uncharacterized protein YcbX